MTRKNYYFSLATLISSILSPFFLILLFCHLGVFKDADFLQFRGNMHLVLEKHASYSYCDLFGQHIGILFKQILRMGIQNKLINILR